LIDATKFDTPSTKSAASLVESLAPIVLVCRDETSLGRSFRNLDRVAVVDPAEVEVGAIVWAGTLLVSETALPLLETRAR
jgi:ribosomal protein L4